MNILTAWEIWKPKLLINFRKIIKLSVAHLFLLIMIINLDETIVSEPIAECIVNGIMECTKRFKKIAFVGVCKKEQKQFEKLKNRSGIVVSYLKDYEKAKEWVLKY